MTEVRIIRNKQGLIEGFRISGHSGYDESGKDIVCSSISTATMMAIGMIDKCGLTYRHHVDDDGATIEFQLETLDKTAELVLETFYEHIVALSKDYKAYVKITEKRR